MRKKAVWTIELSDSAADTGRLRSAIANLDGAIVSIKEEALPFTDEECLFWRERWVNLPDTDFYGGGFRYNIVYSVNISDGKLKIGIAKCRDEDAFNIRFGRALADARCLGDRKLERALLHFTPEQIQKYF